MRQIVSVLCVLSFYFSAAQPSLNGNKTPTYFEVIEKYKLLDQKHKESHLFTFGETDAGQPLHVMVLCKEAFSGIEEASQKAQNKTVILINNGIHPGEPCGIDASILFIEDVLSNNKLPEDVLYVIIPVYNVGGSLNRGRPSRANQNGPEAYGFRGNAQNLDLNRDFIKADAKNTFAFYKVFHTFKPHIFIDTHTSNGADYQAVMSLISTQHNKLNPVLSQYLTQNLAPYLYRNMKKQGWEMVPYVNVFGHIPDSGYAAFLDLPRYASGYTALFNTIGFITETHMWKPYSQRVESTLAFLQIMNMYAAKNGSDIRSAKEKADEMDVTLTYFDLNWRLDSTVKTSINFKGYEAEYPISEISGKPRLKYNRNKKWERNIDHYPSYKATDSVKIPEFYVIPQAWTTVVERLKANQVKMIALEKDTFFQGMSTYITDVKYPQMPYEGHFLINELKTEERKAVRQFLKGDYIISVNQPAKRFIVNVLEPTAADSYLRWNFFDAIFQQKEWFSSYIFEDTALEILKKDEGLRTDFEQWKKAKEVEPSPFEQLYFIYKRSEYYEPEHLRYPVMKVY